MSISYIVSKFYFMFSSSRQLYVIIEWSMRCGKAGWWVYLPAALDVDNDCTHSSPHSSSRKKLTPDITAATFTAHKAT